MAKPKRSLIITNDSETFTPSKCDCSFCKQMHLSVEEWDTFVPETILQKNMKKVVKKIEDNYNVHRYNLRSNCSL